jgi:hypothetical protein
MADISGKVLGKRKSGKRASTMSSHFEDFGTKREKGSSRVQNNRAGEVKKSRSTAAECGGRR